MKKWLLFALMLLSYCPLLAQEEGGETSGDNDSTLDAREAARERRRQERHARWAAQDLADSLNWATDYDLTQGDPYIREVLADSDRVMLSRFGLTFDTGFEVQTWKNIFGFNVVGQVSWRTNPRFAVGLGIAPGYLGRPKEEEGYVIIDKESGAVIKEGPHPEKKCFAMPIFVFANYDLLPFHVTPSLNFRAGTRLNTLNGCKADVYIHAHLGCRVALASLNCTPYLGFSYDSDHADYESKTMAVGVLFTF